MNIIYRKSCKTVLSWTLLLFLLLLPQAPLYAQGSAEKLYQSAKKDYLRLIESQNKQKYRDQWERVIHGFIKVADRFPGSSRADDALYNAGMFTLELRKRSRSTKDTESAQAIFERLAREYPQSRYADDAQYMIGEIYRNIKQSPDQAYRAYAGVVERFPSGDMAAKAGARLAGLPAPPSEVKARLQQKRVANVKGKARVLGVRHWSGSDYVRIVIDLDRPAAFKEHRLVNPDRIYIDLIHTQLSPVLQKKPIPVSKGYLKAIRIGQFSPDTSRVVLDFEKVSDVTIFPLSDPDRIVMDIAGEESKTARVTRLRRKAEKGGGKPLSLSEQLGMKVAKVVIDPGHGGKDPGSIGKSGIMEKEITLDIARRLKKLLEEKLNLDVILTRDRDVFIPLDQRTAIANREKADLFISIHVNAAKNRSLKGVETWFLDLAASERAQKIAARENSFSKKPMSDLDLILNDLLFNNKTQESSRLAEMVQEDLAAGLNRNFKNVQSLGVKGAPFVVLVGARMPSVLSEVAFISNPTEEKRLKSDQYRDSIAQGLMSGVRRYMNSSEYAFRK